MRAVHHRLRRAIAAAVGAALLAVGSAACTTGAEASRDAVGVSPGASGPAQPGGTWALGLNGGSVVISPASPDENTLLLNRILARARFDPGRNRVDIEHAEAAGMDVNIAMSGFVDLTTSDPRLVIVASHDEEQHAELVKGGLLSNRLE